MRYVYDFDEQAPGRPRAARRQGGRPGRDDGARRSGPRRLHDHDGCLPRLHGRRQAGPRRARRRGRRAHRRTRGTIGKALRRPVGPAADVGAVGRRDLDARDDGHDPQPRPERRRGRGAGGVDRQPAVRVRLVPAPDPDVRRGRGRRRRAALRERDLGSEGGARRVERPRARRRGSARADRDVPAHLRGRGRVGLPPGSARAATPRLPGRLRLVGRAPRAGLPAHVRDPRRHRHGGQRRPDGVRQQGRELRHGRVLHPRPVDRRVDPLRRVPRQRAGRGRRRGHPDARADLGDARPAAGGLRAADGDARPARGPLPRHAGHRVHGRGGDALPPADAHRQAHRDRRAADRRRDGRRGADLPRGGGRAHRPGSARPAPAPDDRPDAHRWRWRPRD